VQLLLLLLLVLQAQAMSSFDQQLNGGFSKSRNSRGADPILAEGANPMQSMDLGTGKHAAAAAGKLSMQEPFQRGAHTHSYLACMTFFATHWSERQQPWFCYRLPAGVCID